MCLGAFIFFFIHKIFLDALVNYTNRNANSPLTVTQLGVSYVSATSSALAAAVLFKGYLQRVASPFAQVNSIDNFVRNLVSIFHKFSTAICAICRCCCRKLREHPFDASK